MKKVHLLCLIITFLSLSGCQNTVLKMSGFRKPKVENKQSVYKYLRSLKQDTIDVYAIDTLLFQKYRKEPFKPNWAKGFRPAQIRMYNNEGLPILQWASCEGFLNKLKTFDSLPPKNVNGLNDSIDLKIDLAQYFTLSGQPANLIPGSGYDYYILIYFAKYFPRLTKTSFQAVNDYITRYSKVKFKIYKINVDVQEFWGVEVESDTQVKLGGG
jgi:hypothetical protein